MRLAILLAVLLLVPSCKGDNPRKPDRAGTGPQDIDMQPTRNPARLLEELDRRLQSWQKASTVGDHGYLYAIERDLEERVRGSFSILVGFLRSSEDDAKMVAAMALGFSRDFRAIAPLIGVLKDPISGVRANALVGIGKVGNTHTPVKPLIAMLSDSDGGVRAAACYALGRVLTPTDDRGALAPLLKATRDKDTRVRNHAVVALGMLRSRLAVKELVSGSLVDDSYRVQYNAAYALGRIKDRRAVLPLIHTLRHPRGIVREAAAWALKEITGADFGQDRDRWTKWVAEHPEFLKDKVIPPAKK